MDPNIDCGVKIFYNLNCIVSIDNFNDFHSDLNSHRAMNGNTGLAWLESSWKAGSCSAASEDNCED